MKNRSLLTDKNDIRNTNLIEKTVENVSDGEVLMKIESFALTSNNVTYAAIGHQVKYWNFFPAPDSWGIVPVWGFATVVQSKHSDIKEGEKVYGYFPMAEYLKVKAGKVNNHSFIDIIPYRQEMAPIYNTYNREGMKIKYPLEIRDYIPIIRPLFYTSFLINEFLNNDNFFNAERIFITSASSKTSLGLAYILNEEKEKHKKSIVGLTSTKNVEFVRHTGYYDHVIAYDNISEIDKRPSIVVDMSGNGNLNRALYSILNQDLLHLCKVGLTDWTKVDPLDDLPMAKFFFAPTYAQIFFKKHGPEKATNILVSHMVNFINSASQFLKLKYLNSFENLQSTFESMINGDVDPSIAYNFKPS